MRHTTVLPVIVSLLVFYVVLTSCAKEVKKPCLEALTIQEIVAKIKESTKKIKTFQGECKILSNITIKDSKGVSAVRIQTAVDGAWDLINENCWTTTKTEYQPGQISETEMYVFGTAAYMKFSGPKAPKGWKKIKLLPELRQKLVSPNLLQQQIALFEVSKVIRLADETIEGMNCYVLSLIPNIEKLSEITLQDPGTKEIFNRMNLDPETMFKDMSLKHWYSKDSFLPIKFQMRSSMAVSAETVRQLTGEEYEMRLEMTSDGLNHNFNEPVSIELPLEAEGAQGLKQPF